MMRKCLNPRVSHTNPDTPASGAASVAGDLPEQQIFCRYCRYALEDVLLGDCRLVRWIGSGAFGDVYEAEQLPPLKRRVAVKIMAAEHLSDGKAAELFAREVGSIAALDHPHIMPVLRVGTISGGYPYLVMKYAAHGSLLKFCQESAKSIPYPELPTRLEDVRGTLERIVGEPEAEESSLKAQQQAATAVAMPAAVAAEQTQIPASQNGDADELSATKQTELSSSTAPTSPVLTDLEAEEEDDGNVPTSKLVADQPVSLEEDTSEPLKGQDTVISEGATFISTPISVDAVLENEQKPEQELAEPAQDCFILTPQQLLPFLEQTAQALQYAHEHNIIHLDVKPANLLLDGEDRILLADFGVSVLLDGYTHASLRGYVGTPLYTAPEQWLEQPRPASDQYALAVTCYQLLTGHAPFSGNLYAIMHGHINGTPPSLREFQPQLSQDLDAVILRGLAKEPTERYPDMLSFARAYRRALESSASASTDVNETILGPSLSAEQQELTKQDASNAEHGVKQEVEGERSGVALLTTNEQREVEAVSPPQPELRGEKVRPKRPSVLKYALLLFLILALLSGAGFGALYVTKPCLLGRCPHLQLDTQTLHFKNAETKKLLLTNTGTENLLWHAAIPDDTKWLHLSADHGTLAPSARTVLELRSDIAGMNTGENSTRLSITGNEGVSQDVNLALTVGNLEQVESKIGDDKFSIVQGSAQQPSQTITITNKSNEPLSWWISYSENSWLVVSPSQGTVQAGKFVKLKVTTNAATLSPNTYLAHIYLNGKLGDSRSNLLNDFGISLKVEQNPSPPATATPTFTFPSYQPRQLNQPGAPSTRRSGHAMVWDDRDNLLLVFGGIDDEGTLLNDLWAYNPTAGNWQQLTAPSPVTDLTTCGGVPAPRMNTAMVWDSADQQLLLYGGLGPNNQYLGDLWSFSPQSGAWSSLKCTGNVPGARSSSAVWNGRQMLLLGGINDGGILADFWSYAPGQGGLGWQKISNTTPVGQRAYQAMAWDAKDNRLYLFGGADASGAQLGDFWSYDQNGWVLLQPVTTGPKGRQQAMMAWDSKRNVLVFMGGWEDALQQPYYGLWVYEPKQKAWGVVTPLDVNGKNIVPGRTAAFMVWDTQNSRICIYAGAGNDKSHSSLNDLWVLE